MPNARSVTVALRSGLSDATLPNNVKMNGTKTYVISIDDFGKLSRSIRDTVIGTPTINTVDYILPRWDGTNYTMDLSGSTFHNTAGLPLLYVGATNKFKLGDVVQGFNGSVFKLVLLSTDATLGNVAATTTKNVAVWLSKSANTVSVKTSAAGNALAEFAGVYIGAVTAGNYGWIQVEGDVAQAAANANLTVGLEGGVSQLTDGQFAALINEIQTITLSAGAQNDTFKLTFNGHESSAAVTIPSGGFANTTPAQVQTCINTISDFALAAHQPVVGGVNGTPTVTFSKGTFAQTDVGAITITSKTGAANGSVAESTKGSPYVQGQLHSGPMAIALTTSSATKSDVALRTAKFARRHIRRAKLFFDTN